MGCHSLIFEFLYLDWYIKEAFSPPSIWSWLVWSAYAVPRHLWHFSDSYAVAGGVLRNANIHPIRLHESRGNVVGVDNVLRQSLVVLIARLFPFSYRLIAFPSAVPSHFMTNRGEMVSTLFQSITLLTSSPSLSIPPNFSLWSFLLRNQSHGFLFVLALLLLIWS